MSIRERFESLAEIVRMEIADQADSYKLEGSEMYVFIDGHREMKDRIDELEHQNRELRESAFAMLDALEKYGHIDKTDRRLRAAIKES